MTTEDMRDATARAVRATAEYTDGERSRQLDQLAPPSGRDVRMSAANPREGRARHWAALDSSRDRFLASYNSAPPMVRVSLSVCEHLPKAHSATRAATIIRELSPREFSPGERSQLLSAIRHYNNLTRIAKER